MKHELTLLGLLLSPVWCSATTPAPYAGQCRFLGKIAAVATSHLEQRMTALQLLELVALGRNREITLDAEARGGSTPGILQQKDFSAVEVRACALRTIGQTGLPEAIEFLGGLKQVDFTSDATQQIWRSAQVALHEARLIEIREPAGRIDFLEHTLNEQPTGATAYWAINELCDRGTLSALPIIQQSLRKSWSGRYGEEEVRFCEARIQVVRSNPDRIKALSSVLRNKSSEDMRLIRWVVDQLDSIRSSAADAELDKFVEEISRLPKGSSDRQRLAVFEQEVPSLRRARAMQ